METINIGLTDESRTAVIELLKKYLADIQVLFNTTQGFHWNVRSNDFAELHGVFQGQYEELAEAIDVAAERIRILGAYAPASLERYLELAELSAAPENMSDVEMVRYLLSDAESLVRSLRAAIVVAQEAGDEGTADFFIQRLQVHEKTAWMLRSTLV